MAIYLAVVGLLSGGSARLNYLASTLQSDSELALSSLLLQVTLAAGLGALGLFVLRHLVRRFVVPRIADPASYLRSDTLSYSVFLLSLLGSIGVLFNMTGMAVMWGTFVLWQLVIVYRCLPENARTGIFNSTGWLAFLFLFSGFAALIYQIAWQRVLFSLFGVNIESVTVIVSIFMFGLGVGSLAGGWMSKRFANRLPQLFFVIEIGIAVFGVVSVPLIRWAGDATLHLPLLGVALVVYALLAVPTMLMGATLPILVEYLTQRDANVGKQTGLLYALNTLGSAIACFATAGLLFVLLGLKGAVYTAAFCNLITGVLVYRYCRRKEAEAG